MTSASDSFNSRSLLLCLLECYVLWAIDELGAEQASILSEMTPNLRRVYRTGGEWQDVIAAAMRWPRDMPRKIRAAWAKNRRAAHGGHAAAEVFAAAYVDAHFVRLTGTPRPVRAGAPLPDAPSQKPKLEVV